MDPVVAFSIVQFAIPLLASIGIHAYNSYWNKQTNIDKDNDKLSTQYMKDYAEIKKFSDQDPPKQIKGKHSVEDDIAAVNPLFDQTKDYTTVNCSLCAATYDLRRRGYDVTAKMCRKGTYTLELLKDMYGVDEKQHDLYSGTKNWDELEKKVIEKYPEGARGMINVHSPYSGMGHSMVFEVQKGKMRVMDPQSGDTDVNIRDEKWNMMYPSLTNTIRLDDKKVNIAAISRSSAQMKDDWKSHVPERPKSTVKPDIHAKEKKAGSSPNYMPDYYKNFAEQYKKDHPNTKLSTNQIIDIVRRR